MNDLRSQNRTLTPVPEIGPRTGEIVSNPNRRRSRSKGNPLFESSRPTPVAEPQEGRPSLVRPADGEEDGALSFPVSRELQSMPISALKTEQLPVDEPPIEDPEDEVKAPASRPSRRREVADPLAAEDDKFPWHHQFNDDEPEELQAKSPLLSRAFRSSVG